MIRLSDYDVEPQAPEVPQEPTSRRIFRQCVTEVAENAHQALSTANGRIEAAVKLVLAGDVELLPDGKAKVASQSHGTAGYVVVNGECPCKDFPKAPQGFCKHRTAAALYKRASALAKERLEAVPFLEEPSAPAQASGIPQQYLIELHGRQFIAYHGLLALAHERGLQSLKAHFTHITPDLAVAHAVATFTDGRTFEDSADATPQNVNAKVRAHFPRMALTRSKARVLRDALNVCYVAIEELDE